jgi:hypothetical protein
MTEKQYSENFMRKQDFKTLYHCTYALQYHLVIVTKYRRACLTAAMLDSLKSIVNSLKTVSARLLRRDFGSISQSFTGSRSYGAEAISWQAAAALPSKLSNSTSNNRRSLADFSLRAPSPPTKPRACGATFGRSTGAHYW